MVEPWGDYFMFKVRRTPDEEFMRIMFSGYREEYFGRGLIDSIGLRVVPVPEVDDDDRWHESGLAGYSKQSRKIFGFSLLDDLMGRK